MKNILILALTTITLNAGIAFAQSSDAAAAALEAFKANKNVLAAVESVSQEIRKIQGANVKLEISKPTAVFLTYSCGVKGCSSRYLVTVVIAPHSTNPQGKLVAASVFMIGSHVTRVSVLDSTQIDKILNLLN